MSNASRKRPKHGVDSRLIAVALRLGTIPAHPDRSPAVSEICRLAETVARFAARDAQHRERRDAIANSGCSSCRGRCRNWLLSRAQSVLERDFTVVQVGFAARGLAERDDADFMFSLRMCDGEHAG